MGGEEKGENGEEGGEEAHPTRTRMLLLTLSATECALRVMFPVPRSPEEEKHTPSLETEMVQVSPITLKSLTMRWNSPEGIFTMHLY